MEDPNEEPHGSDGPDLEEPDFEGPETSEGNFHEQLPTRFKSTASTGFIGAGKIESSSLSVEPSYIFTTNVDLC